MVTDPKLIEEKVIGALFQNYCKFRVITKVLAHPTDGSHNIQLDLPNDRELKYGSQLSMKMLLFKDGKDGGFLPPISRLEIHVYDPNTNTSSTFDVPVTKFGGLSSAKAEDNEVPFDELIGALCAQSYMARHKHLNLEKERE